MFAHLSLPVGRAKFTRARRCTVLRLCSDTHVPGVHSSSTMTQVIGVVTQVIVKDAFYLTTRKGLKLIEFLAACFASCEDLRKGWSAFACHMPFKFIHEKAVLPESLNLMFQIMHRIGTHAIPIGMAVTNQLITEGDEELRCSNLATRYRISNVFASKYILSRFKDRDKRHFWHTDILLETFLFSVDHGNIDDETAEIVASSIYARRDGRHDKVLEVLDKNLTARSDMRATHRIIKMWIRTLTLGDNLLPTCCICEEKARDVIAVECGHISCCMACSARCSNLCPVCRERTQFRVVYLA
jgi:hypothetical protein